METCPKCRVMLVGEYTFCPKCGSSLEAPVPKCQWCATPLAADAKFCVRCGAKTDELTRVLKEPESRWIQSQLWKMGLGMELPPQFKAYPLTLSIPLQKLETILFVSEPASKTLLGGEPIFTQQKVWIDWIKLNGLPLIVHPWVIATNARLIMVERDDQRIIKELYYERVLGFGRPVIKQWREVVYTLQLKKHELTFMLRTKASKPAAGMAKAWLSLFDESKNTSDELDKLHEDLVTAKSAVAVIDALLTAVTGQPA